MIYANRGMLSGTALVLLTLLAQRDESLVQSSQLLLLQLDRLLGVEEVVTTLLQLPACRTPGFKQKQGLTC